MLCKPSVSSLVPDEFWDDDRDASGASASAHKSNNYELLTMAVVWPYAYVLLLNEDRGNTDFIECVQWLLHDLFFCYW